jgi:folate-dependent phosphoribosylglycinamide formyltransferase PurN
MKRIVMLTGSEMRHRFMRKALSLASGVDVIASFCEGEEESLANRIAPEMEGAALMREHVEARARSEADFFGCLDAIVADGTGGRRSIPKGAVNEPSVVEEIESHAPDLVVAYGCSLIRSRLLETFPRRTVNIHLGLAPYYRGAATNFWPLVHDEPELVGVTFMHLDAGIDTGEVIHQLRAEVRPGDTPHQIGNRVIAAAVVACAEIIRRFDDLGPVEGVPPPAEPRFCRQADFDAEAVRALHARFAEGLVSRYLSDREARIATRPIVAHPSLGSAEEARFS